MRLRPGVRLRLAMEGALHSGVRLRFGVRLRPGMRLRLATEGALHSGMSCAPG